MVLPQATGASRFWRAAGRTPEPNADAVRLLPAYNYLPHVFGANNWSPAEQRELQQAVLTVAQVHLNDALALTRLHVKHVLACANIAGIKSG